MSNQFKERLAEIQVRNRQKKRLPGTAWRIEKWVEVVTQYLILGNLKLVAAVTDVPYETIRNWKNTQRWLELEQEIRASQNIQMDQKLTQIVEKSLDATLDRVENGDFIYDQKSGEIRRKPASLRDIHRVAVDVLSRRELLRDKASERKETTQITVTEQLGMLAQEFAKWVEKGKPKEVLEMVEVVGENDAVHEEWETRLQEGTGVGAQEEAGESEGEGSTERSPLDDDGTGESKEG